jgi:ketosteroid isomerase-like protein
LQCAFGQTECARDPLLLGLTVAQTFEHVLAHAILDSKVKKIAVDDVKMRVLGNTAIVTGHVVAQLTVQGNPVVEDVRFTRVYARRGERWRMVAGQGTRITPTSKAH